MHGALLRAAALLGLLAVMAAAGGCVALYTLSRAADRPDNAGGDMGLPLSPPGASTPAPPITVTATVTATTYGGDGLPFDPSAIDTPPVPFSSGMETPPSAAWPSSNETPTRTQMETEAPLIDGPPPHDELPRPTLPVTPL